MAAKAVDFAGKVTVADGAWGTELDKLGCPAGYCREEWNVSKPELVEKVAASYVAAGSKIILTNTFGGSRLVLGGHGLENKVEPFNRAGGPDQQAGGQRQGKCLRVDRSEREDAPDRRSE